MKFNHISSVTETYELREQSVFRRSIIEIIKSIDYKLKNIDSEEFAYDWYGSLGTEELVLIVNTDKIKIFSEILEKIRMDKTIKDELSSTYSFIFSNFKTIKNTKESIAGVSAGISLTANPAGNIMEFFEELFNRIGQSLENDNPDIIEKLENAHSINEKQQVLGTEKGIKIYNMIGKYDYHIIIPKDTWNFLEEYNENGIFNIKNDLYSSSIFQIKTNWLINDINGLVDDFNDSGILGNKLSDNCALQEEIDKEIKDLKNSTPEYLKRANHIMHAIELLYIDFKKNMKTIFAKEWREDLSYQFKAFLELLKDTEGEEKDPRVQFQIIEETLNSIRQTYIHITQASRMFFEIPATNLRYTGSYNKILRTYYGIVKQLCYIAYSIPKQSRQSLLIPIITFEYTPKVNTHIYTQTTVINKTRLVVFHLPYEALIDIPKYAIYLAHEIYHYIAPFSRKERNKELFRISLYYHYQEFIVDLLKEYMKKKYSEIPENIVESLIYGYVVKNKNVILDFIDKKLSLVIISDQEKFEEQPMNFYVNSITTTLFKNNIEQLTRSYTSFVKFWIKEARNFTYNNIKEIKQASSKEGQEILGSIEMDIRNLFELSDKELLDILESLDLDKINMILKEEYVLKYENITKGLKEAQCDYFLIQIYQLDLEKYLKLIFDFLYENSVIDKIIKISNNDNVMNSSFWCRVGIIISLFDKSNKNDEMRKEIENIKLSEGGSREEIFEKFKKYVINCHKMYIENFDLFSDDIILLLNKESVWNCHNNNVMKAIEDIYSYIYRYNENLDETEIFRLNIKMMEQFQENLSMKLLKQTIDDAKIEEGIEKGKDRLEKKNLFQIKYNKFRIKVHNMSEYIKEVNEISEWLKVPDTNGKANVLWYRGQTNSNYILLPGLLRDWDNTRMVSPLEYEAGLMNIFCSKATHMRETEMLQMNSTFDWIVLMQHYGIPTNLLDWSENAFVALFFALVKGNKEVTKHDAAVYILNPEYMEIARQAMMKKIPLEELKRRLYPINNLSIGYNSEMYTDFLPYKISESIEVKANKWHEDDTGMSDEWWPRPIVSALSNSRIRAQYGAFTISNLMARPHNMSQNNSNGYDYLAIEEMQHEFMKNYPNENPFLYKIIIDNKSARKMKQELESLGYKYMNVYPELEKTSDFINEQVQNYLFNGNN